MDSWICQKTKAVIIHTNQELPTTINFQNKSHVMCLMKLFFTFNPLRSLLLNISEAVWREVVVPPRARYLNIHIWYEVETYTRRASWQEMTIDDVIILVTWLGYNSQTRNKMKDIYPISGSIATMLISDFVRYVRVTIELQPWHHHGSHVTWKQFTDRIENEEQILYLRFYIHYWLQLCQICWGDIRFEFMTSSWASRDLSKFRDQIENEVQILYLKFCIRYWLQSLSDMLGWQKNYIHDIIMVVTWLRYNLQAR